MQQRPNGEQETPKAEPVHIVCDVCGADLTQMSLAGKIPVPVAIKQDGTFVIKIAVVKLTPMVCPSCGDYKLKSTPKPLVEVASEIPPL